MRLKYREDVSLPYRLQIQSGKKNATYKAASMDRLWARISKEKNNPVILCSKPFSSQHTTGGLSICGYSCRRIAGEAGQ